MGQSHKKQGGIPYLFLCQAFHIHFHAIPPFKVEKGDDKHPLYSYLAAALIAASTAFSSVWISAPSQILALAAFIESQNPPIAGIEGMGKAYSSWARKPSA